MGILWEIFEGLGDQMTPRHRAGEDYDTIFAYHFLPISVAVNVFLAYL